MGQCVARGTEMVMGRGRWGVGMVTGVVKSSGRRLCVCAVMVCESAFMDTRLQPPGHVSAMCLVSLP